MLFIDKLFGKEDKKLDKGKLPVHIAIIPDGNGRWAKKRGLPRSIGHKEGTNALRSIVKIADRVGIKYLTIYAFSTENWRRPKDEVDTLMALMLEFLKNAEKELEGSDVRIRVIGNTKGMSGELQNEIKRVTKLTEKRKGLNLVIALNYGGRDEIINTIKDIARDVLDGKLSIDRINEQLISEKLYTSDIPDPDMIIRTSGELRSSNFLLWQSAYTEYWFPDMLWPDFKEKDFIEAVCEYQKRNRRYGGV